MNLPRPMAVCQLSVWLVLAAGCAAPKSYTILHLETGKKIPVRPESRWPELLLGTDETTRTFRVFGRSGSPGSGFTVRTISYRDARVVDRVRIPAFSPEYRLRYVYGLGFALSPSSRRIAYVDERTKSLVIFDTQASEAFVLRTNFASSIVSPGTYIEWVSERELIASAEDARSGKAVLALYNADDRAVLFEVHPERFYRHACALSPSKEHFAYWEPEPKGGGVFRILNLKACRVSATIKSMGAQGFLTGPGWSEDSTTFLYLDDGALMSFHLPTTSLTVLKQKPNRQLSTPISCTGQRVLCLIDPHDGFPRKPPPIYVLDVPTAQESVITDPEISGEVIAAESGNIIIYGMGQ